MESGFTTKNKAKWKRGIRCHLCGKLGHLQKECYQREKKGDKPDDKSSKKPLYRSDRTSMKRKSEDGSPVGLVASVHALSAEIGNQRNRWIVDSGATCHICCNESMFDELDDLNDVQVVTLGNGRNIETAKQGTVRLKLKQVDVSYKAGTLQNVLDVPELSYNLLSISKVVELGKTVHFTESTCKILDKKEVVAMATKCGSLYYLCNRTYQIANVATGQSSVNISHHCYGHLNVASLRQLADNKMGLLKDGSVGATICVILLNS